MIARVFACLALVAAVMAALPCQSTVRGKTYNLQAACHANGYANPSEARTPR